MAELSPQSYAVFLGSLQIHIIKLSFDLKKKKQFLIFPMRNITENLPYLKQSNNEEYVKWHDSWTTKVYYNHGDVHVC